MHEPSALHTVICLAMTESILIESSVSAGGQADFLASIT